MFKEKRIGRCVSGLKPNAAAKVANERWINVGSPPPQQIERSIPLTTLSGLKSLVKLVLSLGVHRLWSRGRFDERVEILREVADTVAFDFRERLP